jgi:hypothetical protein
VEQIELKLLSMSASQGLSNVTMDMQTAGDIDKVQDTPKEVVAAGCEGVRGIEMLEGRGMRLKPKGA